MAEFCSSCGTEIGFFSRKRVRLPDGAVVEMCKACASRPRAPVTAAPPSAPPPRAPAPLAGPPAFASADPVERIIHILVAGFRTETGMDVSGDPTAMGRIRTAAEKAVAELRATGRTEVNLPFLAADGSGPKHLLTPLDRRHLG